MAAPSGFTFVCWLRFRGLRTPAPSALAALASGPSPLDASASSSLRPSSLAPDDGSLGSAGQQQQGGSAEAPRHVLRVFSIQAAGVPGMCYTEAYIDEEGVITLSSGKGGDGCASPRPR